MQTSGRTRKSATVVSSDSTSPLDNVTAADWLKTRLPTAALPIASPTGEALTAKGRQSAPEPSLSWPSDGGSLEAVRAVATEADSEAQDLTSGQDPQDGHIEPAHEAKSGYQPDPLVRSESLAKDGNLHASQGPGQGAGSGTAETTADNLRAGVYERLRDAVAEPQTRLEEGGATLQQPAGDLRAEVYEDVRDAMAEPEADLTGLATSQPGVDGEMSSRIAVEDGAGQAGRGAEIDAERGIEDTGISTEPEPETLGTEPAIELSISKDAPVVDVGLPNTGARSVEQPFLSLDQPCPSSTAEDLTEDVQTPLRSYVRGGTRHGVAGPMESPLLSDPDQIEGNRSCTSSSSQPAILMGGTGATELLGQGKTVPAQDSHSGADAPPVTMAMLQPSLGTSDSMTTDDAQLGPAKDSLFVEQPDGQDTRWLTSTGPDLPADSSAVSALSAVDDPAITQDSPSTSSGSLDPSNAASSEHFSSLNPSAMSVTSPSSLPEVAAATKKMADMSGSTENLQRREHMHQELALEHQELQLLREQVGPAKPQIPHVNTSAL